MKKELEPIDFQKEAKKRQRKERVQAKVNSIVRFVEDNKEMILILAPATLGVVTAGIKAVNKHVSQRNEKLLKENYCYDRSLGHYWKLKRELTNDEWIEIDRRKKNGERLADILDEMKVLK